MYVDLPKEIVRKSNKVAKSINFLYFRRKLQTTYIPTNLTYAPDLETKHYHDRVRLNWNDEDVSDLLPHYDERDSSYLKPILESGLYFWMVDPDPLISVNDLGRLCKRNNLSIDDFKSWVASNYESMKWLHSMDPSDSFENIFSPIYAQQLHQTVWVVWDQMLGF